MTAFALLVAVVPLALVDLAAYDDDMDRLVVYCLLALLLDLLRQRQRGNPLAVAARSAQMDAARLF